MRISALVERLEKFRFEFDGEILEGEYWKYKTTTTAYAKAAMASIPEVLTEGTDKEKAANLKARSEALEKVGVKTIADTIKTWNATGDDDEPLPITLETFEALPLPFVTWLIEQFNELRNPKVNPPTPSPST